MKKIGDSGIISVLLTSLLLIVSWPPLSFTPLLFIAFVPLFMMIDKERSWFKGWLKIYMSLFFWSLGTMYWIGNTKVDSIGLAIMVVAWLLIPLFQSVPMLIFMMLRRRYERVQIWYLMPFLWVSYEYLHSHWQLSFTWLNIGFGLSSWPWITQFYEITGFLGGTWLVMSINVLLFQLYTHRTHRKIAAKFGYACLGLILSVIILNSILHNNGAGTTTAKVAIIQPNTDPYEVLDEHSLKRQVGLVQSATNNLREAGVDLVVLPEGYLRSAMSAPFILDSIDNQPVVKALKQVSMNIKAPILTGFIGFRLFANNPPSAALPTGDGRYFSMYNGAMLIAHDQDTQIQLKNNLVPFMERIPYLEHFSFFESFKLKLNQAKVSYEKDDLINTFIYKNLRIGTLICLDALYTDYATKFIRKEANLIAIIANDGWAGKTSGYHQNAAYASAVATSLNRDIARSATTGKSLFLDQNGRKYKITNWDESRVIVHQVRLHEHFSIYARFGDWMGIVSILISIGIVCFCVYQSFIPSKPI